MSGGLTSMRLISGGLMSGGLTQRELMPGGLMPGELQARWANVWQALARPRESRPGGLFPSRLIAVGRLRDLRSLKPTSDCSRSTKRADLNTPTRRNK